MKRWGIITILFLIFVYSCAERTAPNRDFDPTIVMWYTHPADKWENALPVGNGRLGAMVFGKTDEEKIQFNEETYWSGGPYSQTVQGGYRALPEIQRLIFEGEYLKAHKLFGRHLMGYPVEQQKYQSFGDLVLKLSDSEESKDYVHQLDLDRAIVTTSYEQNGVRFKREVFVTPVDQVIVVRLTAGQAGCLSFVLNLRGYRNNAHSNYATDYFQMDGYGDDGLILKGKSADYLGVEGKIRYQARLKAILENGQMRIDDTDLIISHADAVTLYIAAATNFINYRDVSADPGQRVDQMLQSLEGKSYEEIRETHTTEHQRLFRRVAIDLGSTSNSYLPTDERLRRFNGQNDPNLAALCFQFGRYMLISSSRPGTQPANLQGIWNQDMNPSWDSKYTTNINTEMNYWPAEVGNLSECAEPLFTMIKELTEQGSDVAREHYGCQGWVFHQNTDIWRVAAPMDGPDWGAFATGGAWLSTHLWEHFLFTGDKEFLEDVYPVMKGSVEFFLDFLVEHPKYGWLVTNPSTSPENFPDWPGNEPFYDEVCAWMSPGTTICAGSTIDMQLLRDLFGYVVQASDILDVDHEFRKDVLKTRERLAPMQIGKGGDLQEWLEDWGQKEKSHRHISHLFGLFPGNQISTNRTPGLAEAAKVVLLQRDLVGNGWASAWKMGCWARLYDAHKAVDNFNYYIHNYSFDSLFAICSRALQVDGLFGVSAAIAEMLLQSHEDELHFLPALPQSWPNGEFKGLKARGGFEVNLHWREGRLVSVKILSTLGKPCRVRVGIPVDVFHDGSKIEVKAVGDQVLEFKTEKGKNYEVKSRNGFMNNSG
ncbi:MAG: glycoside hydrolase family 95 protein [Candidatus Aminicenantes bacterium]|nr:glycoside hydrolase family 95 protein [Candidatus Aminicenantes bacterium]MDH5743108.1 glycoside hydrolase family 95 protein [Candidatus Aminicenantes bacterium]